MPEPDRVLRARMVAALRPHLSHVEADLAVDRLLPEIASYAEEFAGTVLRLQADLLADIIATAQDCLDVLRGGP